MVILHCKAYLEGARHEVDEEAVGGMNFRAHTNDEGDLIDRRLEVALEAKDNARVVSLKNVSWNLRDVDPEKGLASGLGRGAQPHRQGPAPPVGQQAQRHQAPVQGLGGVRGRAERGTECAIQQG
jgi:hypothetical protein